jgi:hypothetical protein
MEKIIMQTLHWLDTLGTIEDTKELINRFCWNLDVIEKDGQWHVTTGDEEKHAIFSADSLDAINIFIYGMALAYGGIPPHLAETLQQATKEWMDSL